MGYPAAARCGRDLIAAGRLERQSHRMTEHRPITTGAERPSDVSPLAASNAPPPAGAGAVLSAADYAELMRELDDLRSRHRREVSRRLRDARDFGSPGDDDDRQAIREDAAFAEARIARVSLPSGEIRVLSVLGVVPSSQTTRGTTAEAA
jgi:PHD/YefM family antitoxin component YafN of YafNO toxin-antitoxin module